MRNTNLDNKGRIRRRIVSSIAVALFGAAMFGCGGGSMPGQPAAPAVMLSTNSLAFPDEGPGGVSPTQAVAVRNSGTAPLQITAIKVGADFQEIDDCGSPLPVGSQCVINITFVPTVTGNLQETVTVTDNAPGSPHNISLSGNGIASPPGPPTLTGYCVGIIQVLGNKCALVKDEVSCPVGRPQYSQGLLASLASLPQLRSSWTAPHPVRGRLPPFPRQALQCGVSALWRVNLDGATGSRRVTDLC